MLLEVDINFSHNITDQIDEGDLSLKPGWVRMSIHPTMTDKEIDEFLKKFTEEKKDEE